MRRRNKGECYLCGTPATTRDHVPPLGLFPEPRPNNLITVPACDACNSGNSLHDEYFRVVVAAGSRDSGQSIKLLHQRIGPRIRKSPALISEIMKSVKWVDIKSEGGIHLGRAPSFPFDRARLQTVIDKTVKGLFYKHTKRRLMEDYGVDKFLYNPKVEKAFQDVIAGLPLHNIGDGSVFSYRYYFPDKAGSESYWFLMFYNDTTFFITKTSPISNLQANLETEPTNSTVQ